MLVYLFGVYLNDAYCVYYNSVTHEMLSFSLSRPFYIDTYLYIYIILNGCAIGYEFTRSVLATS